MIDSSVVSQLSGVLDGARLGGKAVQRLTLDYPDLNNIEGYKIQKKGINSRLEAGETVVGYKMGLTSKAKMEQMGLDQPIYGVLTNSMQVADKGTFSLGNAIHPKIEPEIAFVTCKDLGGKLSLEEVLDGVEGIVPALEILDSRFEGFKYFSLPDVIADNCSSSHFVVGSNVTPIGAIDLAALQLEMFVNEKLAESASSSTVLENPANAVVELCSLMDSFGETLPAGSIVLSGAATKAVSLEVGMNISLKVKELGDVFVTVGE